MSIIGLIVAIAIIGLVLWLVTTYVPMPAPIKTILIAVVALLILLWVLQVFGLVGGRIGPVVH